MTSPEVSLKLQDQPRVWKMMMNLRPTPLSAFAALTVCGLAAWAKWSPPAWPGSAGRPVSRLADGLDAVVERVDRLFARKWASAELEPAAAADDLQVLRRLSLALLGTVPSLEEIRKFEEISESARLQNWTVRMLSDRRSADYLAERMAVALIGDRERDFPGFRRERYTAW